MILLNSALQVLALAAIINAQALKSGAAGYIPLLPPPHDDHLGLLQARLQLNIPPTSHGPANSCNVNNQVIAASTQGACQRVTAYYCNNMQPQIVNSTIAYGFAGHGNTANTACCKCYKFTWRSGAGTGKTMIVQAINAGGLPSANDFDIYLPAGGVGDFPNACHQQYGAPASTGWGRQYGGVTSDSQCSELPAILQAGCHWRWEWAGGDVNNWNIFYEEVNCLAQLYDISGCCG